MNSAILVLRKRSGEDGVKQAVAEKGYSGTHNIRKSGRKEPVMAYKKPQMVAKSESKKSYVAGCPEKTAVSSRCDIFNNSCLCGPLN